MASFIGLSPAHVVLQAVHHTINADIAALRQLTAQRQDVLKLEITLRILLTYLPAGTNPDQYIDFLREISQNSLTEYLSNAYDDAIRSSHLPPEQEITEAEARLRVKRLRLVPLKDHQAYYNQDADPLTLFVLRQAHRIDSETGSLDTVQQLVEPFVDHSEVLRVWAISYLLPLLRLDYEYYPRSGPSHLLADFEKLDGRLAVQSLLSKGVSKKDPGDTQNIGRDLKGLVGPWMYGESTRKRRKLDTRSRRKASISTGAGNEEITGNGKAGSDWSHVNDWLVDLSCRDFQKSVDVVQNWAGPSDVDYGDWGSGNHPLSEEQLQSATQRYAQTGLAAVYAANDSLYAEKKSTKEAVLGSHRILLNVAELVSIDPPASLARTGDGITSGISREFLDSLSPTHLLHNALLRPGNPLTTPSKNSIMLFNLFLFSSYKLFEFGNFKSSRSLAELSLFASQEEQRAELKKTLFTLKSDTSIEKEEVWPSIRRQLLWLQHWERQEGAEDEPRGIFGRIAKAEVEVEILKAMLDGGAYSVVVDIYCKEREPPLSMTVVEDTITSVSLNLYDAANHCGRVKGSALGASYNIIETFRKHFQESKQITQIRALLSATNAISHYALTLQNGVPLRPVNIRASKDPISLIGKILSQNRDSYTKLDDLLDIGNHLVMAGLVQESPQPPSRLLAEADQAQYSLTSRRISKMAIEAALEAGDFDTAYSKITTSSLSSGMSRPQEQGDPNHTPSYDDISWRAVYQAGCYPITASTELHKIEQRLELLAQTLLLAPPSALSEVLVAWQQCEQAMMAKISQETEANAKWDDRGDRKVPGGFAADSSPVMQKARDPSRNALVEEAPMGLFDVARGAAAALSKNAFPLRGVQRGEAPANRTSQGRPLSTASLGSSDEGDINGAGGQGRVRKRDMVSSMVTGGLASGIGWVIGESGKVRQGLYAE